MRINAASNAHHATRSLQAPAAAKPPIAAATAGLQLGEIAGVDDDPPLESRQTKSGDEQFTHDDEGDHPALEDTLAHEHDQGRQGEELVRHRIEQRAQL